MSLMTGEHGYKQYSPQAKACWEIWFPNSFSFLGEKEESENMIKS